MPKAEFYRDLHCEEWRIRTMKAIEKVIPEFAWNSLLEDMLAYQTFDRDPEGYIEENGLEQDIEYVRFLLNDNASYYIDQVARY
jgi:hypothetical protein